MLPAASVSGIYFANPHSSYFSVGKIQKDQVRRTAVQLFAYSFSLDLSFFISFL